MGYAHYWSRPAELPAERFAAWAADVRRVIAVTSVYICGPKGYGQPITNARVISFNGNDVTSQVSATIFTETEALESFEIKQRETSGLHLSSRELWNGDLDWVHFSCKTGRKPYDTVVTASLALFAHYFPRLCEVKSDGKAAEWQAGLSLAREATGVPVLNPSYTHFWNEAQTLDPAEFAAWSADLARVIAISGIRLAGPDGTGDPVISPTRVAFNGAGDDAYGPFLLTLEDNDYMRDYYDCMICKTGQRPYDRVVTAALILLAHHLPAVLLPAILTHSGPIFETSGTATDWGPGLALAQRATGRSLTIPPLE